MSVVVTGFGMRTAVGNHATQTCASVRAGVSRFAEWPHFGATLDEEGTALIASATQPDLGNGSWIGKAIDLVTQPLHEATLHAGLYDLDAVKRAMGGVYRAAGFLAVPHPERPGTMADAFRQFLLDAQEHCIAPFHGTALEVHALDQAGGMVALARAVEELQANRIEVAVVGGVDSYLDNIFLSALHDERRLKVPALPAGLIPGEAAAFLVLEREADARRRGATPLARIVSLGLDAQAVAADAPDPAAPDALTNAVNAALNTVGGAAAITRVISDLNGERWRFQEWAIVETRCLAAIPTGGWQHWHPADTVGDLGAAFVPFAVGLAARAFERGYAGQGITLICTGSDRGQRAAACVSAIRNGGN